jgi:hypothetical protein
MGSAQGNPASCGHPNPTWWTDSRLWNEVMTGDPNGESPAILCPICFAELADNHFAATPGNWKVVGWLLVPEMSRAPRGDTDAG